MPENLSIEMTSENFDDLKSKLTFCPDGALTNVTNCGCKVHCIEEFILFFSWQDRSGLCPLHRAAQRGNTAAASALIGAGANVEEPALFDGATSLLLAIADGQERFARWPRLYSKLFRCLTLRYIFALTLISLGLQVHSAARGKSCK